MIVVTGTGRSGTTLLIKILSRCGLAVGPAGGFGENADAIRIDGTILRARGYLVWERTDEMSELVGNAIRNMSVPAWKSTALPYTLDVWWRTRQDMYVIVCHRRLDASTRSFEKAYPGRGQLALVPLGFPVSVGEVPIPAWLPMAFGQLMDVILTNQIPHVFFHFPQDIRTPYVCWNRLSAVLEPHVERSEFVNAMLELVDESQVHW